jgi:transcriptional regulator with XRE-family HTH domain
VKARPHAPGMNRGRVARLLRAIRLHQGLSQQTVADKARISQSTYSRAELGDLAGMTIGTLERVAGALGADVQVEVRFRGGLGDRLADAMHAALVDLTVGVLTSLDWLVELEYGFNVFGERGSVDILAWHAATRTLLTWRSSRGSRICRPCCYRLRERSASYPTWFLRNAAGMHSPSPASWSPPDPPRTVRSSRGMPRRSMPPCLLDPSRSGDGCAARLEPSRACGWSHAIQ